MHAKEFRSIFDTGCCEADTNHSRYTHSTPIKEGGIMKRRAFTRLMAAAGIAGSVRRGWAAKLSNRSVPTLPQIAMNGNSVEICINSRYSFHSGYSATVDSQVMANALWAAASAPLIASQRTIYAATADGVYTYSCADGEHRLETHVTGNKLSERSAAFEIGIATDPQGATEDAGVALHWAHLASVAFWTTAVNCPACCPKESAKSNANSAWDPSSEIHCVNCYGTSASVTGLVTTVKAGSSDFSLPDPVTNGTVSLEEAIANPVFGTDFKPDDLTPAQISQILWASYGCTPHMAVTAQGLSVASHMMGYFLTGRIYVLSSLGVQQFYMRQGTDSGSSDHRIELISGHDVRPALRSAVSRLPQNAPLYIVFCGRVIEYKQLIEAGYCGGGALLQATALGLQGHYAARFTETERSAIQSACNIPEANLPMLVFSAGIKNATASKTAGRTADQARLRLVAHPAGSDGKTLLRFDGCSPQEATIRIFNPSGGLVKTLRPSAGSQSLLWDGTDRRGRVVAAGRYTCTLVTKKSEASIFVTKL